MGTWQRLGPDPADRDGVMAVIRHAVERAGITFVDTGAVCGPSVDGQLVGEALAPLRSDVVIATRFGWDSRDGRPQGPTSRPEQIRRIAEGSLRRLRTDVIDLFYQHRVDPHVPIEDVAGTVGTLVREGKVRHFGLSGVGESTIRRAQVVHPVTAVQSQYSLWMRDPERAVLPTCAELGIGFLACSPLGRGCLTGGPHADARWAADDTDAATAGLAGENVEANQELVAQVRALAAEKGCTPGQVALAWLLAQQPWIVPFTGARHAERVDEDAAATLVALSADEVIDLDQLAGAVGVRAERSNEVALSMVGL